MASGMANDAIRGIFLLLLAVAGNFVAETLGCSSQKLLSQHMYAKHVVICLLLYFAIGFTSSDRPMHPTTMLLMAVGIYVAFIMFTKMHLTFTLPVFGLLAATYINSTFINYYEKVTPEQKVTIEVLQKLQTILEGSMIGLVVLGFALYYRHQRKEHRQEWSTLDFVFGVTECDAGKT